MGVLLYRPPVAVVVNSRQTDPVEGPVASVAPPAPAPTYALGHYACTTRSERQWIYASDEEVFVVPTASYLPSGFCPTMFIFRWQAPAGRPPVDPVPLPAWLGTPPVRQPARVLDADRPLASASGSTGVRRQTMAPEGRSITPPVIIRGSRGRRVSDGGGSTAMHDARRSAASGSSQQTACSGRPAGVQSTGFGRLRTGVRPVRQATAIAVEEFFFDESPIRPTAEGRAATVQSRRLESDGE